jgi:glucose/arabinose dehydrogenase
MFVVWKLPVRALALAVLVCFVNSNCGGNGPTPPPNPGASSSPGAQSTVTTGRERLAWVQQAANSGALGVLHYAAYVDGIRSELTDVSCDANAGPSGFQCGGRLPSMSQGVHTIELAAFIDNDGSLLESARSSPLEVNVLAQTVATQTVVTQTAVGGTALLTNGATLMTADRLPLRVDLVTEGLEEPTDMAFTPDGRIFVTERAGRVRVTQEDRLQKEPALRLDDVAIANGGGLIAIAVDPQFPSTHFIYVIYTMRSRRDDLMFRLARFREVLGMLGERAVLLEGIPANQGASATLRFGRDGKLYAAFDDGGDPNLREKLSSFNGKILRLNPDASTPSDNTSASPVYAHGFQSPRGFDWQPASGMLWLADRVQNGTAGLHAIVSGDTRAIRGTIARSYVLPSANDTTAILFYHGTLLPSFEGNLLMANEGQHYILRARLDENVPPNIIATELLLQDRVGAVRALGIGRRGEIYFTSNNALERIVPP